MPRVFIVEEPKANIDITKAERFGELVFVFDPHDRRCSVFDCQQFGENVLKQLDTHDFSPEEDYLCIVGSMITVMMMLLAASARWPIIRTLFYSANEGQYVSRVIDTERWR